jgi:hypothetical protein
MTGQMDFFASKRWQRKNFWQRRKVARVFDVLFDWRVRDARRALERDSQTGPQRKVLIATVAVPGREKELDAVLAGFRDTRHDVTICAAPMGNRGKFDNINLSLRDYDLSRFDWVIVTDDDVTLPPRFLDGFLHVAEALSLKVAQPAHRCLSYATFTFNYRRWNSLGRTTGYVESGPITAFHRDIVPHVIPFPVLRWAWGTDIVWAVEAERRGMAIGIVDATPIEHLKEVASTYHSGPAIEEARAFLASKGIRKTREEMFVDRTVLRAIGEAPAPA